MRKKRFCTQVMIGAFVWVFLSGVGSLDARAHCDTESGPVAVAARKALESEDLGIVAIWVGEAQDEELHAAFERSVPVYQMGGKAKELAEQHFMETAVRLHRAAEGFPYTGLKPEHPLPEDVAAAEQALETGDLEPLSTLLTSKLRRELERLFQQVQDAGKKKHRSVADGREWADAYVRYVTYVHVLHQTILEGPEHGVGD